MENYKYQVIISEFADQYNKGNINYLSGCVVVDGENENIHYDKRHF